MRLQAGMAAGFFSLSLLSYAQERRLTRAQLPLAVASAVDRQANGATVKGFSTEVEHGKRVYEAETIFDGRTRDLQFAGNGDLEEVEEEVALTSLPRDVQHALAAKAKGARVVKVESLVKHGTLVAYEASLSMGMKRSEIQVGPHGESLVHPE